MCALWPHIKPFIFGLIFSRVEKAVSTFSIFEKIFPKVINYCVPLGHTLAKSIYIYIYVYQLLGIDMFVSGGPLSSDDEQILCKRRTYQK